MLNPELAKASFWKRVGKCVTEYADILEGVDVGIAARVSALEVEVVTLRARLDRPKADRAQLGPSR